MAMERITVMPSWPLVPTGLYQPASSEIIRYSDYASNEDLMVLPDNPAAFSDVDASKADASRDWLDKALLAARKEIGESTDNLASGLDGVSFSLVPVLCGFYAGVVNKYLDNLIETVRMAMEPAHIETAAAVIKRNQLPDHYAIGGMAVGDYKIYIVYCGIPVIVRDGRLERIFNGRKLMVPDEYIALVNYSFTRSVGQLSHIPSMHARDDMLDTIKLMVANKD